MTTHRIGPQSVGCHHVPTGGTSAKALFNLTPHGESRTLTIAAVAIHYRSQVMALGGHRALPELTAFGVASGT